VRIGVVEESNGEQTPWESSSLMGSFSFNRGGAALDKTYTVKQTVEKSQNISKSVSPSVSEKKDETNEVEPSNQKQRTKPSPVKKQIQAKVDPVESRSTKPNVSPEISRYIQMLSSKNADEKRKAAKYVYKRHNKNRHILDVVERELLRGYQVQLNNKRHIDAMSWFCKVLGKSGQKRYLPALQKVAAQSGNRKLQKYAQKSMRYIK
jgi:hypothetical protein